MSIRIKICGITNPADAAEAVKLGVDLIGLNFFARSPRFIDDGVALSILRELPAHVEAVALFVKERLVDVKQRADGLLIGTVQIHGDHQEILPAGVKWIPAFSVRAQADLDQITEYLAMLASAKASPHAVLVDAHVPGMYGGTGRTAPWNLLANFKPGVPLILAGGLTPENVAEAIRIVRPNAVDVASGVERAPGKKDAEKMRRFIDAARSAG